MQPVQEEQLSVVLLKMNKVLYTIGVIILAIGINNAVVYQSRNWIGFGILGGMMIAGALIND